MFFVLYDYEELVAYPIFYTVDMCGYYDYALLPAREGIFYLVPFKGGDNMSQTGTDNRKKIGIGIAVLVILIAAVLIIYFVAKPKATKGAKALTIEVVDDQGASTSYEVHTDAEYLRQAMEEADGLTFDGTESEYGMMVETVNGVTADYNADGSYWAFFSGDSYCEYGIDTQPVADGETYRIVYTID